MAEEGLFITGRLKELLIVRGCNYYPQDLEDAVCRSYPALERGQGAAFGVEAAGEERVVMVFEPARNDVKRAHTPAAIEAAIAAVSRSFGLQLHDFADGAAGRATAHNEREDTTRSLPRPRPCRGAADVEWDFRSPRLGTRRAEPAIAETGVGLG